MIINLVAGGDFNITNLILNLSLSGLYVCGAIQMKTERSV